MKHYKAPFIFLSLLVCMPFAIHTANETDVLRHYENDVFNDWNEDCSQMCCLSECCADLCVGIKNKVGSSSQSSQKESSSKGCCGCSEFCKKKPTTEQIKEDSISSEQPRAKTERRCQMLGLYGFPTTSIVRRQDPRSGIVRATMV